MWNVFFTYSLSSPKCNISSLWKSWIMLSLQHGSFNRWLLVQTFELFWIKTILGTGEEWDVYDMRGSQLFLSSNSVKSINKPQGSLKKVHARGLIQHAKNSRTYWRGRTRFVVSSLYHICRGILWCTLAHVCNSVSSGRRTIRSENYYYIKVDPLSLTHVNPRKSPELLCSVSPRCSFDIKCSAVDQACLVVGVTGVTRWKNNKHLVHFRRSVPTFIK